MLALGYALLHSLWQGTLVGLALLFVLSLLPSAKARLRYAAACTALVCILGLPLLSFYDAAPMLETAPTLTEPARPNNFSAPVTVLKDGAARVQQTLAPSYSEQALRWFVKFWVLGVFLLCLRFGLGYILSRRLRRHAVYAAPHAWAVSLAKMSEQLGLAPPRLLLSAKARVPLVIGYFKPVILVPASIASNLSVDELELILAHELAHIKRHDYFVNLLQSLAEILLFYHPVAWWINRVIRQEREHCCDDLALSVTGNARAYAHTLLKLETLKSPSPSLAVTGGNLMTRFKRLAEPDARKPQPTRAVLSLMLILGGVLAYFNFGVSQNMTIPDESTRARLAQEIKDGFDIASPFENIRWNYRDETQVQVDGSWYDLVSINKIAEQDLVTFARDVYRQDWQKRLSEDLLGVMSQLGQPPKDTVSLTLRDNAGQSVTLSKVAMSEENRWKIWQARNPDRDVATGYPKLAPFSDITWDENELPLVSVDNKLYRLLSIDAISLKRITAFAQRTYDDWWQKRIAEDLVAVLSEMGSPLGEQVTLQVVDVATEEMLLLESDMTHAKRQAVWAARQERGN